MTNLGSLFWEHKANGMGQGREHEFWTHDFASLAFLFCLCSGILRFF